MGELYACDGHYESVHGTHVEGCGSVFAPGVGRDDIYESDDTRVGGDPYIKKGYCPQCGLQEVVVVEVTP